MIYRVGVVSILVLSSLLGACGKSDRGQPATAEETETADEFVARVNRELVGLNRETGAANWVRQTYITDDTAIIAAAAEEKYAAWHGERVKQAKRYDGKPMRDETRRALDLLKLGTELPSPADATKRKELALIATELKGIYSAGKSCSGDGSCRTLPELEDVMAASRDYDELLDAWQGWRTVAQPMRQRYERYVELVNEGANELGYSDLGDMWRSGFDMSPAEFEDEAERLWEQVKPLYDELHCYARAKLGEVYGEDKVPQQGMIPAHLLGNMWAQQWSGIYDLLQPYPGAADLDVDAGLKKKDYSPQEMVRSAESFYLSLGMRRLPDTFWERSQFTRPRDREVNCHASAWGLDGGHDLRIKMCIKQTYDELQVIYHELGHNYYQDAYKDQPSLFRGGAHSGFHEAIGDTITLSMTPEYLAEIGLVGSAEQSEKAVINRQMLLALDKIAFLPFGKLIDEWRWDVFSGDIAPGNYNAAWWELRRRYQGVSPPVARSETDFDPGAKYHIPANRSYTRYFLAFILQFQFQRALCEIAGHGDDLQSCSIYGNRDAGARLLAMMASGQREPWQDALEKLTGTREMDATAIIDYFAPLMGYLKQQNADRRCGW